MSRLIITLSLLGFLSGAIGCTDPMYGLKDTQKTDLRAWEDQGVEFVQEKNPATATALGFFIGLGAFYTDQPALGVIDLLTWPISILWEPWIVPAEANKINYNATKDKWMRDNGLGIYGQFQKNKIARAQVQVPDKVD